MTSAQVNLNTVCCTYSKCQTFYTYLYKIYACPLISATQQPKTISSVFGKAIKYSQTDIDIPVQLIITDDNMFLALSQTICKQNSSEVLIIIIPKNQFLCTAYTNDMMLYIYTLRMHIRRLNVCKHKRMMFHVDSSRALNMVNLTDISIIKKKKNFFEYKLLTNKCEFFYGSMNLV